MATTRDSALYTKLHVNKYLGDARDRGGRVVQIPFEHTTVSGETGGASAGVQDLVDLCVLPANCEVIGMIYAGGAFAASAGVGCTLEIGDSGDADRYASIDADVASVLGTLLSTGLRYRPTADTIVTGRWSVADPIVAITFKGCFLVVPGA